MSFSNRMAKIARMKDMRSAIKADWEWYSSLESTKKFIEEHPDQAEKLKKMRKRSIIQEIKRG